MVYIPRQASTITNLGELIKFVEDEFRSISKALSELDEIQLRPLYAEPEKYREGMVVYADGTIWNPGGGKGVYVRTNAAWVKL